MVDTKQERRARIKASLQDRGEYKFNDPSAEQEAASVVAPGGQGGPRVVKLNLLVLRTPRLEEMLTFYSTLGVSFECERHGSGPQHYATTLADGLVLELYPSGYGLISSGINRKFRRATSQGISASFLFAKKSKDQIVFAILFHLG